MISKTGDKSKIKIRRAKLADIDKICKIEAQQFTNPWKQDYFTNELDHHIAYFYVGEDTDSREILGYIIFWIIEDMLELHKIAVSADSTGKGIGKQLFGFMLDTAMTNGVEELFLEVRKSNEGAIKLYEAFHFQLIDVRKAYYPDPIEDALIYKLILRKTENNPT